MVGFLLVTKSMTNFGIFLGGKLSRNSHTKKGLVLVLVN